MRACARMTEERADTLCCFRRENMLEFAGFFRDFVFIVHVKSLGKEAFCEPMAADHVFSPLAALFRKDDHVIAVACMLSSRTERHMTAVEHLLVSVRLQGMFGK